MQFFFAPDLVITHQSPRKIIIPDFSKDIISQFMDQEQIFRHYNSPVVKYHFGYLCFIETYIDQLIFGKMESGRMMQVPDIKINVHQPFHPLVVPNLAIIAMHDHTGWANKVQVKKITWILLQ